MNIDLFKSSVKRNHTILFIFYTMITLNVYLWFWVFSRKKIINKLSESKIDESLPVIFIILGIISTGLDIFGGIQSIEGIQSYGEIPSIYSYSLILISFVLVIVISFQMKKVLKEFSDNNEIKITYHGFFTFLFNFCYINYKLNENLDHINQNSLFDNESNISTEKLSLLEKNDESTKVKK